MDHSVTFEDGEFTFRVSPVSLNDFERIHDLYVATLRNFRPPQIRALIAGFVEVAKPERNAEPLTADDFGSLDPNLVLGLVNQWDKGVRDVPLPLPLGSSATEP